MRLVAKYREISSPNYYHGNSITRLVLHNLTSVLGFFRRRGPSRNTLKPLRLLKNSKKGQRALVLGSGPSLSKLNLNSPDLVNFDVFAVNSFFQSPAAKIITPDFYCLSDPNYFVEDQTNVTFKHDDFFRYLEQNKPKLLISHFYRRSTRFRNFSVIYFNDREFRWMRSSISPERPRAYVSLTLYKSLAIAIYLGYAEILVLGMDNNEFAFYESDSENSVFVNYSKYFAEGMSSAVVGGQQKPESFTSGLAGRLQFFGEIYGDLEKFAKHPVWNLDENSLIATFPKLANHPLIKES
jgi:hypothetical protein